LGQKLEPNWLWGLPKSQWTVSNEISTKLDAIHVFYSDRPMSFADDPIKCANQFRLWAEDAALSGVKMTRSDCADLADLIYRLLANAQPKISPPTDQ
jgi:hypothetical protein